MSFSASSMLSLPSRASQPSSINLFFFQFSCFFQALNTKCTVGFVECIPNTTSPKSNNFYVHNK